MILLKTLALILSLYGWLRFIMRRLRLPAEAALPFTLVSVACVVSLAGLLNLMREATYLLWAAGLALAVVSLLRREPLRAFFTPGLCFFAAAVIGLAALLHGARFVSYDDFSHWALIARTLLLRDALPTFRDTALSFLNYPPGSACWIYFVCRLTVAGEDVMMFAQAVMMAACMTPLFLLSRSVRPFLLTGVLACGVFLGKDALLYTLHVDHLLPMVAAAGMLLVLLYADDPRRAACVALPFMVYDYLIKNSGLLFALLTAALLLALALRKQKSGAPLGRRDWLCLGACCSAAPIVFYLWNRHTTMVFENASATKHAMRPGQLIAEFSEKTAQDISAITSGFWAALPAACALSLAALGLIALLAAAASLRKGGLHRPSLAALGGCALVELIYLAGLWLMYLFSMPTGEALAQASMPRYISTLDFWASYMALAAVLAFWDAGAPTVKKRRLLPGCAAALFSLCFLALYRAPSRLLLNTRMDYPRSERAHIEELIQQNDIPAGKRYVLLSLQDSGLSYYVFQYLLDPQLLSLNLEDWQKVDAVIVYDPKPLELVYLNETVLASEDAPTIYDCTSAS